MTDKQGWLAKEVARARKRRETLPEHARPTLVKQGHQVAPIEALADVMDVQTPTLTREVQQWAGDLRAALTEARQTVDALVAERDSIQFALDGAREVAKQNNACLIDRAEKAEAERDAYRKAKQENDERFMLERDEARAERDAAREALARVEAQIEQQPSCGDASRDHDGCFVADSLRIARAALTERLSESSDGFSDEEASDE